MTSPSCPQCDAAAALFLTTGDHNRKLSELAFDYFKCPQCGFIFLDPVPADLGRYYPASYYDIPKSQSELKATAEEFQSWKLDIVQRHSNGGKLLEIGPAYGLFAFLAKSAGFEVTVIEMDHRCCDFLRDTVGVNVVEGADTIERLQKLPQFDVIVLWQVIEHLPDPWVIIDTAAQHLAPGGVLIFDTPNPQAFQFGVLGRFWTHVDAPRHVTLIPAPLAVERAKRAGLTVAELTAADRGANGFNGFGWAFSLKNFFSNETLGRIAHFSGRVLAKILIPIERTGFRGSTYTAVFRKERTQ